MIGGMGLAVVIYRDGGGVSVIIWVIGFVVRSPTILVLGVG